MPLTKKEMVDRVNVWVTVKQGMVMVMRTCMWKTLTEEELWKLATKFRH